MLQVPQQLAPQTNWPADCCRSSRVDLCGGSNVGKLAGESLESFAKRSSERKVFTRCCTNPWEFEMRFLQTDDCCGAAFIGGWKFEMNFESFDQPLCMRCNEHSNKVDFILDWCSCHSGGVLKTWSFAANGLDGESLNWLNVSGQSSVALSHRRKLFSVHYARCCTNPRKLVLSLRTRSLFRFLFRLGRKPQWENFVCFLQCSMISDFPPGHASEVSKERFLEENDFSCSWPLSRQVRTTVSTARYRCMRLHAWPSASCLSRSLVIESSPPQ